MADDSLPEIPHKCCTKCSNKYPATTEYFALRKDRPIGLSSWCRSCQKAAGKAQHAKNRARNNAKSQAYRAKHRDELLIKSRESWALNRERHSQKRRAKYQENAEAERKKARERRALNPQYGLAYRQEYRKRKPEVHKVGNAVRRTRKLGLPSTWTPEHWRHALCYWHHACAVCGNQEGLLWKLCADHWIPVSDPACPGTVPGNMLPLCHTKTGSQRSCNTTKHNRNPVEWLTDRLGKRKAKHKLKEIEIYFASLQTNA